MNFALKPDLHKHCYLSFCDKNSKNTVDYILKNVSCSIISYLLNKLYWKMTLAALISLRLVDTILTALRWKFLMYSISQLTMYLFRVQPNTVIYIQYNTLVQINVLLLLF